MSLFHPSNMRIESEDDLLLVRLLMGAQPTLLMVAAAEARMFDHLGDQDLGAAELAKKAGLNDRATRIVLDGLVGLGVLAKENERYRNTPTSLRHLRIGSDQSYAVRLWISGTRQWERLPEILRTGELPAVNGEVEAWRRDGTENNAFIRTMCDIGWMAAQSVADAVDLSEVNHLVDLGGGPAHYTIAMLERSRILRATVVDLPLTLMVARDSLVRRGMAERVNLAPTDLFDAESEIPIEPESAELVLMSHIVHMDGPEQNAALVRKAARILKPGGKIIVHDMFLEEDRAHPQLSSLCAVHLLAMTQRGEMYPASVISGWLAEAGLDTRIISKSPFLIEGMRPTQFTE